MVLYAQEASTVFANRSVIRSTVPTYDGQRDSVLLSVFYLQFMLCNMIRAIELLTVTGMTFYSFSLKYILDDINWFFLLNVCKVELKSTK